jgi:hypothetical protein
MAALGLFTHSTSGQIAGNPVYPSFLGTGIGLNADLGGGINEQSGEAFHLGGRLEAGLSVVSMWAGAGLLNKRVADPAVDDKEVAIGGGFALNIISSASFPVASSLNVGAGTVACDPDCTILDVVAGPAVKLNSRTQGFGIEPWVMPRIHLAKVTFLGASVVQTGFGGSAGVNVGLSSELGLHVALDIASFPARVEGTLTAPKATPIHAGVGVHYRIGFLEP